MLSIDSPISNGCARHADANPNKNEHLVRLEQEKAIIPWKNEVKDILIDVLTVKKINFIFKGSFPAGIYKLQNIVAISSHNSCIALLSHRIAANLRCHLQ